MSKGTFLYKILNAINPFHWVTSVRNWAFDCGWFKSTRFDTPTICIGNITVGGTGKTPHTEYLIKLLSKSHRVAVLSRGYGRKSRGYIKATPATTMPMIGDEPHQIMTKFKNITVAVDEKRVRGINCLINDANAPQLILLDDAYQHRYVKAGLNILLVDNNRPVWRDTLLPIGRLRESMAGIERADIIIVTKCPADTSDKHKEFCRRMLQTKKGAPVFFSTMRYGAPYPLFAEAAGRECTIEGSNILLLTGIAKPAPLKAHIGRSAASVTLKQYADHHNFSEREIADVADTFARTEGRKLIITTEKDAARLTALPTLPPIIKANIYALPIEVDFLDGTQPLFDQTVIEAVAAMQKKIKKHNTNY